MYDNRKEFFLLKYLTRLALMLVSKYLTRLELMLISPIKILVKFKTANGYKEANVN